MIYLIFSIIISSFLFVIFKYFEIFKVDTLQAIVVNYLVAFTVGISVADVGVTISQIPHQPWFVGSICLGLIFISVFNVMALTSQKNGLSVASVSGKMSVVIPIVFAVIVYNDTLGVQKIIGIILALFAVFLTSMKSEKSTTSNYLLYPILLFLGSGLIDTLIKYIETTYVQDGGVPMFSATTFLCAFVFGLIVLFIRSLKSKIQFQFKNIIAGIVLGIPNYFSIDFLIRALKTEGLESSSIFTINNVSAVLLTTVLGVLFFKEKLERNNWIGIGVAVLSIIIIATM